MVLNKLRQLHRYMRDRLLLGSTVALLVLAAVSQSLLWWMAPPPRSEDTLGPPRSGYTVTRFHAQLYDADGVPGLQIIGPWAERRDNDDSLFLTTPHFIMPSHKPGVPDWTGNSDYGWVNRRGDLMVLQGKVAMHRDAYEQTPAAELHSSNMTGWPKQNRLATDEFAIMTQGSMMLRGVGMRANLDTNELDLLHDVHGTYPPRTPSTRPRTRHHPAHPAVDTDAGHGSEG
ncbi:LPS export ABC transporter periplasmic protein LptC [Frateuria aurantia]